MPTTRTVTSLADTATGANGTVTLRQALAESLAGDTIVFDSSLAGGTIALASTLDLTVGVTVDGTGRDITISGGNAVTDFVVDSGATAPTTLKGLTIADGHGVGAPGGTSTTMYPPGGDAAGGVFLKTGTLNLVGDKFVNDTATGGQGGLAAGKAVGGTVQTAGGPGGNAAGGIYVEPGTTVTASDLSFSGNTATGGAGGVGTVSSGANGKAYPDSNSNIVNPTTHTVTSLADTAMGANGTVTLRQALAESLAGDTIVFDASLAGGTIALASTLDLTVGVTIDGTGRDITISGGNAVTDFVVDSGTTAPTTLKGLTIANGHGVGAPGGTSTTMYPPGGDAAGGVFLKTGTLNLVGDKFVNDVATGGQGGLAANPMKGSGSLGGPGGNAAGAVYVEPGTTVTASDLFFSGNAATGGAGGVGVGTGAMGLGATGQAYPNSNSNVVNPSIHTVTSLADTATGANGTVTLRQALAESLSGDTIVFDASLAGGTIALASTLDLTVGVTIDGTGRDITVSGGNAVTDFVVDNSSGVPTTLKGLTIADGHGTGAPGGISTTMYPPGGDAAGGVFLKTGTLNLVGDRFVNDTATGGQGGVAVTPPSKGSGAVAGGPGGNAAGGVYVEPGTTVTASDLSFSGNAATGGAGGVGAMGTGATGKAYPDSNSNIVACYCPGTLIMTTAGEVPIERLAIGDRVVTAAGLARPIRWIGRRSYAGRFANGQRHLLPVRFAVGSLADGVPRRDLWVSPKHAMLIDGVLIPAEQLVNGVSVVQAARVDRVDYLHVELDSHDALMAEGAPSESFVDDDSRFMFHNAHEYALLYPDAERVEAAYCAPRVEDGFVLDGVRARIAARAGLADDRCQMGALRGVCERASAGIVSGWAQTEGSPGTPVCLDILVDGARVVQVLAAAYREDLQRAGIGDGCHGFSIALPAALARAGAAAIAVRRSADGAPLPLPRLWSRGPRSRAASAGLGLPPVRAPGARPSGALASRRAD